MSRMKSRESLRPFLSEVLTGGDTRMLVHYLIVNSNLPGSQANTELAQALSDEVATHVEEKGALLWGIVATWSDIDAEQAPSGNPREYLPFCAAVCMGALGAASDMWWLTALDRLRFVTRDTRPLVFRGGIIGLQRLLESNFLSAADELIAWVEGGNPREMRAVAEAVAEPILLTKRVHAEAALALHRALIDTYLLLPIAWRDQEDYRNLRTTLCYSVSVAVAAFPDRGFMDMRRWAARRDPDLDWLLLQNLNQPRLVNVYQADTEGLLRQLKGSL